MRFTYAEAMVDPTFYVSLAQQTERCGYDGFLVPDSVAYPLESDSTYPFTPDGNREFLEGKPFLEPFALISALGTVTSSIRFVVSVLKLPIRHPIHTAKLASSAAVLSQDRLVLGVGVSPWPDDYAFTATPWKNRGMRMDACIEIVRDLMAGGFVEHHDELYDFDPIQIRPVPAREVPILIGGHSDAALRRAARLDGWIHGGGGEPGDLERLLDRLDDFRAEAGTLDKPFEVHVISGEAYSLDGLAQLEERGVTDVCVGFRWPYEVGPDTETLQTKLDAIEKYATTVIEPFRARSAG